MLKMAKDIHEEVASKVFDVSLMKVTEGTNLRLKQHLNCWWLPFGLSQQLDTN